VTIDETANCRENAAMIEATEQAAEQAAEPRWKHQLTGGSRLGKPNKTTQNLKEAIERAFDRLGGVSYLEHVGRSDPRTFCALLSKLLPTKLTNADGSPLLAALTELTDAQLEARTARALADAQRVGLMGPAAGAIDVQAVVIADQVQAVPEKDSP
jgi:hypothetical protein